MVLKPPPHSACRLDLRGCVLCVLCLQSRLHIHKGSSSRKSSKTHDFPTKSPQKPWEVGNGGLSVSSKVAAPHHQVQNGGSSSLPKPGLLPRPGASPRETSGPNHSVSGHTVQWVKKMTTLSSSEIQICSFQEVNPAQRKSQRDLSGFDFFPLYYMFYSLELLPQQH